ncbi:hypothetical protein CI102_6948 [Trichoderma harzianum]|nr:hypothetical protein CI102_6948 [Trichoderma harzianum]
MYCTVLPRRLQMIHRRQDGMERWPETAPVSLCWVQSQNLGKSGDAWSRNGVPSPRDNKPPDRISRPGATDWDNFHGNFFFLSLPGYLFFQLDIFFFFWLLLRGRGTPQPSHARTDQISVMPLGNSIINRHGAKPGVNASAPRTLAPVARGPPAPAPYCTKVIRTTHWSCRTSL